MHLFLINYAVHTLTLNGITSMEATWLRGQRVGLAIQQSQIHIPLWPLAGFVLSLPEFKSTATLLISQPVASCEVGVLILEALRVISVKFLHVISLLYKTQWS